MRFLRFSLPLALALSLIGLANPGDVAAQPSLRVGGGISSPNGDMGDLLESGYHGRVMVQLGIPVFPVSLRAEGAYHRFDGASAAGGTMTQLNGALSAVLSLGGIGIGPYFFGGIGKYRQDFSSEFLLGDAVTESGIHAGFGVEVGILGFGGFVEARLVNVNAAGGDLRYVPITVGIKF